MPHSTAGIILAGGLARRMGGGDKAMLPLSGRPLLSHVIDRLSPQVAEIALNANGDPARFADFNLPVIPDTVDGFVGPLGGVLAGMRWAAKRGHTHIVSAAADTPFFPTDLVARLTDAKGTQPIAMAATDDPERGLSEHPTFALWPVDLADDLEQSLTQSNMRKVIVWTSRHGCARAVFDGDYPFFNVNTPEDLAEAEAIARRVGLDPPLGGAATRLATYGTLAPGQVNHHQLQNMPGAWSTGTVRGHLHREGWGAAHNCPGIVLDPDGQEVAVHIFTSPDLPAHWDRLDAFEGVEYRRITTTAETADGPVEVSIYQVVI
ncbi:MAG: molybdenum cofactor guanylyltransferase MobA [Pseudomonadota bacterium]